MTRATVALGCLGAALLLVAAARAESPADPTSAPESVVVPASLTPPTSSAEVPAAKPTPKRSPRNGVGDDGHLHRERGVLASDISAQRPLALGLELGEASGIRASYLFRGRHEAVGFVGYSLWLQSLNVRADYLYRIYRFVPAEEYGVLLGASAGGGLRLGLFEPRPPYLREVPFALGARVPVALTGSIPPLPVEVTFTLAPGLDALPTWRFRMEGSLALSFRLDT